MMQKHVTPILKRVMSSTWILTIKLTKLLKMREIHTLKMYHLNTRQQERLTKIQTFLEPNQQILELFSQVAHPLKRALDSENKTHSKVTFLLVRSMMDLVTVAVTLFQVQFLAIPFKTQ